MRNNSSHWNFLLNIITLTHMCKLFDRSPDLSNLECASFQESSYDYLSRSGRPEVLNVRNFIEDLYSAYPDTNKKQRLKTEIMQSDGGFDSAFFELFLYSFFIRLRCTVEIEPNDGILESSVPDFLVTLPSRFQFYCEATVDTEPIKSLSNTSMLSILYDYINNNLTSEKFFLRIDVKKEGSSQPSGKQIVNELRKWIDTIDWERVKTECDNQLPMVRRYNDPDYDDTKKWTQFDVSIESNGWTFIFSPIPKEQSAWSNPSKILGVFPMISFLKDSKKRIEKIIRKKRKQHKQKDKPLCICINSIGNIADREDYETAIYGETCEKFDFNVKSLGTYRIKNGLWENDEGMINQNIPFIISFMQLNPWNANPDIMVYEKPGTSTSERNFPDLPTCLFNNEKLEYLQGKKLYEIFRLSPIYPSEKE